MTARHRQCIFCRHVFASDGTLPPECPGCGTELPEPSFAPLIGTATLAGAAAMPVTVAEPIFDGEATDPSLNPAVAATAVVGPVSLDAVAAVHAISMDEDDDEDEPTVSADVPRFDARRSRPPSAELPGAFALEQTSKQPAFNTAKTDELEATRVDATNSTLRDGDRHQRRRRRRPSSEHDMHGLIAPAHDPDEPTLASAARFEVAPSPASGRRDDPTEVTPPMRKVAPPAAPRFDARESLDVFDDEDEDNYGSLEVTYGSVDDTATLGAFDDSTQALPTMDLDALAAAVPDDRARGPGAGGGSGWSCPSCSARWTGLPSNYCPACDWRG